MRRSPAALVTILAVGFTAASALAVHPGTWFHHTEADFSAGETKDAIVTNLGEVELSRATQRLGELKGDDSVVYDIVRLADGTLVAATGPEGKLVRIEKDGLKTIADDSTSQVFSLATDGKGVWVACSGSPSRVEYRSGADLKVQRTIALPDTRYVWSMALDGDRLWLATGTKGKVLAIDTHDANPKPVVALSIKQDNVLCLGLDAHHRVYAGTDGDGLVYRITPANADHFKCFIIFDAPEPEVGALLVDKDGTVYAGTADAQQAKPGRLEAARNQSTGRPDKILDTHARQPTLPNVPPRPEPKHADHGATADHGAGHAGSNHAAPPATVKTAQASDDHPAAEKPKVENPANTPKPAPTAAQYNALRKVVAQRLEGGQPGTLASKRSSAGDQVITLHLRSRSASHSSSGSDKQGNAIYRISPDGFVKEIFRESVMVLRIVHSGGALLVATGNEGQIFRIDPDAEEVSRVANLDPRQVPAMLALDSGDVLLGTANPGRVLRMSGGYADSGTITSQALDAKQISLWGKLQVTAKVPAGCTVAVQTRSGNVADPEAGSWSDWSDPQEVRFSGDHSSYLDVTSPSARFLQYRLTLDGKPKATPTVQGVSLKYLMPNLEPRITSIRAEYPKHSGDSGSASASHTLHVEWEATDPNHDRMVYTLESRPADTASPWVTVADKLDSTTYDWNTRTAPDGRYELRVTASDAPDNVPDQALSRSRRSDPVIVDNTPPDFGGVAVKQVAPDALEASFRVTDALNPVAEVRYSVSGQAKDDWKLILPSDLIYDSTDESFSVRIRDLSAGRGVLTLRATDALGNSRYLAEPFKISK